MSVDMTKTVAPKTDQLNADDLFAGKTLTLKITGVKGMSRVEQPIAISYEGDNGKPWKPSLGMRRVLIELWGEEAAKAADQHYTGRRVTLYRDPDVKFGKDVVGGIRISHASNINSDKKIALTVSKARRVEFVVKPLKEEPVKAQPAPQPSPEVSGLSQEEYDNLLGSVQNAVDLAALGETGKTIAGAADKLTADEKAELQAAYGKRGKELRGEI